MSISRAIGGFSLVELLTVMAILAVLAAVTIPAFNSIGRSQEVAHQGEAVNDQINQARQLAAARNRSVELRLISIAEGGMTNWATQIFESGDTLTAAQSLSRLQRFPDGVVINESQTVSPILGRLESATTNFPSLGQCKYYALRFSPNGRLGGSLPPQKDYVTLQSSRDSSSEPVNYLAIQINAVTGRVAIYRP